jgi:hypothetical protein
MVNRKCTVDLYIRIRDEYRVFAARGAILPEEQLQRYAKERIYALVPDDVDPQEHQEALLMEILTDTEVSPQTKADITYQVSMNPSARYSISRTTRPCPRWKRYRSRSSGSSWQTAGWWTSSSPDQQRPLHLCAPGEGGDLRHGHGHQPLRGLHAPITTLTG